MNRNYRGGSRTSISPAQSNLVSPAQFSISSVPGTNFPSTQFASVPGVTVNPGAGISNALGIPSVAAVSGFPSQEVVVQSYIAKPWEQRNYETRIGRGQLIFSLRESNKGDEFQNIVTLPQINEILRRSYQQAETSGVIERARVDTDTMADLRSNIEQDLEDSVTRKRRLLSEADDEGGRSRQSLVTRLKNTNEKFWFSNPDYRDALLSDMSTRYLSYLSVTGIMDQWNYIGAGRNIEDIERMFKLVNVAVRGPLDIDNIWGSEIQQSKTVGLVLTRAKTPTGDYKHFVFRPWIEMMDDSRDSLYSTRPTNVEMFYEDFHGSRQQGEFIEVGSIGRVTTTSKQLDRHATILSGVLDTPTSEFDAWKASDSRRKPSVFVTLGKGAGGQVTAQ